MSIYNQPLEPHELPTTRHSELLSAISKVLREAMILPSSTSMEGGYYDISSSPDGAVEDFNSHTYEDILATAILNKVLKTYGPEEAHEVTLEVTHETTTDSTTDTDSGLSGAEKPDLRQSSSRHRVTKTHLVPSYKQVLSPISSSTSLLEEEEEEERGETKKKAFEEAVPHFKSKSPQVRASSSPDQGVIADSLQPESWSEYLQDDGPPLQFKVEEHVEEVTTRHLAEADSGGESGGESDAGSSQDAVVASGRVVSVGAVTRHSVSHKAAFPPLSGLPPDPSMVNTRRVSFPELGADILQADSCSDNDCCEMSPGDVIMEADSWEENWLFKKQKVGGRGSRSPVPPVAMLIPNPTQDVRASVGNRDIDELSELSERYSVASLDPWVTSESEGEEVNEGVSPRASPRASQALSRLTDEIVAEFSQKDQDYTVDYTTVSQLALYRQECDYRQASPALSPSPGLSPPPLRHPQENLAERPVPKPRKVSLASRSASRTTASSKTAVSSTEDLSILSPPSQVPHEDDMSPTSDTVCIVTAPEDVTAVEGRTLRLSVQARAKGPMGLSWYHNGVIVGGSPTHWVWRRGTERHLQVFSSGPETAGTYAVAAYTANDTVWASCRVALQGSSRHQKRPNFTKGLSHVTLEEEGELTLECQVTGHPEPRVYFSKGSTLLEPSARLSIDNDQYGTWTLRLSDVTTRDGGEYTATAKNEVGYAAVRCQVNVVPEDASLPLQESSATNALVIPNSTKKNRNADKRDSGLTPSKVKNSDHRSPSKRYATHSENPKSSSYRPVTPQHRAVSSSRRSETEDDDEEEEEEEVSELHMAPPKPGTIAEREYRKWERAVPIKNNPYAPEKLASRLSGQRPTAETVKSPRLPGDVIEFPESPAKETPPSLKGGVLPQTDLTRYSRDYYIPNKDRTTSSQPKWNTSSAFGSRSDLRSQVSSSLSSSNGALNKIPELKTAASSSTSSESSSAPLTKNSSAPVEPRNSWVVVDVPLHRQTPSGEDIESVKSSQPSDWKDDLKDIQEAHVVKQVARLQRTINETQQQWEQSFRSKSHRHSQPGFYSSADTLDRGFVSLEGSRDDLWRTASADTLDTSSNSAGDDKFSTEALRLHSTSDDLTTGALSNTPSCDSEHHNDFELYRKKLNRVNNSNNMKNNATYRHSRSIESMSGGSDGDTHVDYYDDSDGSSRTAGTPDDLPALPSVKMLATKFDRKQENFVNNLDKRDRKVPEDFYGNKNIVVMDKSHHHQSDKPFNRALSNNLNRSTEKLYSIKEPRPLLPPEGCDWSTALHTPTADQSRATAGKGRRGLSSEVHSLTARSVPLKFREGLKDMKVHPNRNIITVTQPSPFKHARAVNGSNGHLDVTSSQTPPRDTRSPEHLGIPLGPASIPVRNITTISLQGDTSDDSTGAHNFQARNRTPKRRSGRTVAAKTQYWEGRSERGDEFSDHSTVVDPQVFDSSVC